MTDLNILAEEIYANNVKKGFYDDKKNIGEMLALIHSEVSEALECDRIGRSFGNSRFNYRWLEDWIVEPDDEGFKEVFQKEVKDTFEDELADIMIRVMDLAAFKKIDLETHIRAKMRYNQLRPHKHGKKY